MFFVPSDGGTVYSSATGKRLYSAPKVIPSSWGDSSVLSNTGTVVYHVGSWDSCLSLWGDSEVWNIPNDPRRHAVARCLAVRQRRKTSPCGVWIGIATLERCNWCPSHGTQTSRPRRLFPEYAPLRRARQDVGGRGGRFRNAVASVLLLDAGTLTELKRFEYVGDDEWGHASWSADLSAMP